MEPHDLHNKRLWEQTLERAIKTFAQTVIAAVGVTAVAIDQCAVEGRSSTAATATVLSVLTVSPAAVSGPQMPEVVPTPVRQEDPSETVTDVSVPIPAETTSAAVLPTGGVVNNIAAATDPKTLSPSKTRTLFWVGWRIIPLHRTRQRDGAGNQQHLREPSGWVSIQTAAPYQTDATQTLMFSIAGLVLDTPTRSQVWLWGGTFLILPYTPTGAQATFDGGFAVETPAPGITASLTGTGTDGARQEFLLDHAVPHRVGTDNFPNSVSTLNGTRQTTHRARYYERDNRAVSSCSTTKVYLPDLLQERIGRRAGRHRRPSTKVQNNTSVARVQDAIINNTNVNDPVMNRFRVDQQFLLNYARWQSFRAFSGDDADGAPQAIPLNYFYFR